MSSDSTKSPRAPLRFDTLAAFLEQKLDREPAVLDLLLTAELKGQGKPELWPLLHEAAQRDGRLSELGAAYERVAKDKKIKSLPPAGQAEVLINGALFFADVQSDPDKAIDFFEKVIAVVPEHPLAFERLEKLLMDQDELGKLCDLYLAVAPTRPDKSAQLELLRMGIDLSAGVGDDDRAGKLYQQVLKIEPGDAAARNELEEIFVRSGRFADAVALLEQAFVSEPALSESEALAMRGRAIRLYLNELKQADKALVHLEELLRVNPADDGALYLTQQMLSNRNLAPRAASLLADAYDRAGNHGEAAKMLAVEIDSLRGTKRVEAQKKLATLVFKKMGDIHGAFSHFEAIVAADPGDEEFRARFREIAAAIDKRADAAKALSRSLMAAKDPGLKARINAELGELYAELGDVKKAKLTFQGVVDGGGDEEAVLRAARAMAGLAESGGDQKLLIAMLEKLVDIEDTAEGRAGVGLRLAQMYEQDLSDPKAAARVYRKLFDTGAESEALSALERLYEAEGNFKELASVLERKASLLGDSEEGQEVAFRAADIRTSKLNDRAAALESWRLYIATHGPSREVHARMFPLLEQEKKWEELAQRLGREVELAEEGGRPALLSRIGQIRFGKLGDEPGGLEAFRDALALDRSERTSRSVMEKALSAGTHRAFAADVLEPIAREEGAADLLVRVLETRGALAPAVNEQLAALAEAASVCEKELSNTKRALEISGRGLCIAVDALAASDASADAESEAGAWLARVLSFGVQNAAERAEVLNAALDEREVTTPWLLALAEHTGEALAEGGKGAQALSVFRRALAFAPSSPKLLARVDELLQDQGSPEERAEMYRTALDNAQDAGAKRKLLHKIGMLELSELGNPKAAIETFRKILSEDALDRKAYEALLAAHRQLGPSEDYYADLSLGLSRAEGKEREALRLQLAEVALSLGNKEHALEQFRGLLADNAAFTPQAFDTLEKLAIEQDDVPLLFAVLTKRVADTEEPGEQARLLERLGDLASERQSDKQAASEFWKRAGAAAEKAARLAGDEPGALEYAQRLYERVLGLNAGDLLAAEQLVELYRRGNLWEKLPPIYEMLLRAARDAQEAVRRLLSFEEAAIRARVSQRFVDEAATVDRLFGPLSASLSTAVQLSLARVLAADVDRQNEAATIYRRLLESTEDELRTVIAEFEAFLDGKNRHEDRRYLYAFRLARAAENERIPLLLSWARDEERAMGDPKAASELYARVLSINPDHEEALEARSRLLLDAGDVEGAVELIAAQRNARTGEARAVLDRHLATLYIEKLARPWSALSTLEPVLEENPGDEQAIAIAARTLEHPDTRGRAAEVLEQVCDRAENQEIRTRILDMLLATPAEAPELRAKRTGWFERLLAPLSDNPQRALEVTLRAVAERPNEAALWDRVEQLGHETGKPEMVAEAYRREIQRQKDDPKLDMDAIEEIGRRAVEYHEQWKDDPTEIAALLAQIVELIPESTWAFERLKMAYNASEQWEALFSLYDRALSRSLDRSERTMLLEEAVEAARNLAIDTERTMGYLEQLLPLKKDARTRASLERLYEKHGRFRPLIDLLSEQLGELDLEAAQRMRARIAGLWLDGLNDPASAFDAIAQILKLEPTRSEGVALLEKLLELSARMRDEGNVSEEALSARAKAAAILEDRYRSDGKAADLVRVLEISLERLSDVGARAARLREITAVRRDMLSDLPGALEASAALFVIEPNVEENRAELERLAALLKRHDALAEALRKAALGLSDRGRSRKLLIDSAAVYRDHLNDLAKAIDLHTPILELSEGNDAALLEALQELDRLLKATGRAAERCTVLERLAAVEADSQARKEALGEAARIAWSDLGDADRAIADYRLRLRDDALDLDALDGIAGAQEQTSRFRDLVETLGLRADAKIELGQTAEGRADFVRAARILDENVGDADAAIGAWNALRERLGPDAESGDALAALLSRREKWDELVTLLEHEIELSASGERHAALLNRLGDVHRDHTLSWERSVVSYARGGDAGSEECLVGLEVLLSRVDREAAEARPLLAQAVNALTEAYRSRSDWKRLVALLEVRLIAAESDAARVDILQETARMLELEGLDLSGAFDATWRAFMLIPSALLSAEALRLARAAGRFQEVADALTSSLDGRADVPVPVLCELWWNVALWHRDTQHDPDAAERAVIRALSYDPDSLEMLTALADLQRRNRNRPLVDTLLRLAELSPDALTLYQEAVETALDPIGDRALGRQIAEQLYSVALARAAGAEPPAQALWALDVLVKLAREDGDRARVMDLCLKGAEIPFPAGERKRLRMTAAEVAETESAIAIYKSLFDEEPEDQRVASELETLYRTTGRTSELIAMRKRQVEVAPDVDARVALRFDLSLLYARENEREQALEGLRLNLSEAPLHVPSVEKLGELLEQKGSFVELVELLEGQAALRETLEQSARETDMAPADLWGRAAILAEQKLLDIPRAIADHRRAAAFDATTSLDALARLLTARGEHARAAEVLDRLCILTPPESAHVEYLRLADALVEAGDAANARGRLEYAASIVKNPTPVRERLAVLYREAEAWGPLADLIASEAIRIESRTTRAAKLREAAELHLTKRNDAVSAAPLLEQAAELLPDDMPVRLTLVQAYVQSSRLEDATSILRGLLASYGGRRPKERAIVHYELARVLIAAGSKDEALEELEAALRIDPAHPDILYASAKLALDMNQLDRASRAYRALLLNVRRARDDQSNRLMRTEILFALSEIAERQGEPERAAEYFDSAFEASRESAEERERLVGALRARGRHGMLARALEARLASATDPSQAVVILDELAQVYEDHLGRPDDALATRLRAIRLDPIHDRAHVSARALAERTGHKARYIKAVSGLIEEAQDENRRLELLMHLGRAYGGDPAYDEQARSVYTRAEEMLSARPSDPKSLEVWTALDGLYERRGEKEAQAQVLEKRIAAAPPGTPAEQADPMYRLAAIRLLTETGQEQGCALLERAFSLDPQPDRVEEALRSSIARIPGGEPALHSLERFARETGRPRALLDAILMLHGIGRASVDQLSEAVTVARELCDDTLRESCLRALLSVHESTGSAQSPSEVLVELGNLREVQGDSNEAAALFEKAAEHLEQDAAHALLLRVAAIARGPLADLPRAAKLYESLRKANPPAREAWEPLLDIYRQLGDETSLSDLIEQTAPLLESQSEQSKLRIERAKIVMQSDPERAISLFNEILASDPSQVEASILLADILEKAGRHEELADVLSRQLVAAKDRSDKPAVISISMKLGSLSEGRGDEPSALAHYRAVLDWDDGHLPALHSIIRLGKAQKDADELGAALSRLIAIGQPQTLEEAAELALHIAELRTDQGDAAGAEQALEAGFGACPGHTVLRQRLIDAYTAREDWQKLAQLHLGEASRKDDKAERIESLCNAAEVLRERAGDTAGAARILEQALDIDPSDRDVLLALTDACDALNEHERAVRSITLAMLATPDDAWLFRSRAIQREALGLHDEALADLEQAYAMSGGGYAHELSEQLESALARASAEGQNDWESPPGMGEIQRNIRLRLAEVLQKSGEIDRARAHLSEIVAESSTDRDALRALAALEHDSDQPDAAANLYARLAALEEGEELIAVAAKLADACERAGRLADARAGLERALAVAPSDAAVRERLRKIYAGTGANLELSALLLEDAEQAETPAARVSLTVQAARLLLDTENGAHKAMEALQNARPLKPDDQDLLLTLADACAASGENDEARAVIAQIIAGYKGRRVKQLSPVYHRLSRIESSEGKTQEALAALSKAFEMDPGSGTTAMALGLLAVELSEFDIAGRAFRSVTMMKAAPPGSTEGITSISKALAYYHLGSMARAQGDPRKARLMVEKAVNEDPNLEAARTLLDELKAG